MACRYERDEISRTTELESWLQEFDAEVEALGPVEALVATPERRPCWLTGFCTQSGGHDGPCMD